MALVQKELKKCYIWSNEINAIYKGSTQVRPYKLVIFDDFQWTTLDTSKWTDMSTGSAYVQVNNGLILSNNNNSWTVYLKSNRTIEGTEKKITMEMTITEQQWVSEIWYWCFDQPNWGYSLAGIAYSLYYSNNPRLFINVNWTTTQTNISLSTPIKYKMELDFVNNTTSIWVNDTLYKDKVTIPGISNYIWKPVWIWAIAWISNRWNKIWYISIIVE